MPLLLGIQLGRSAACVASLAVPDDAQTAAADAQLDAQADVVASGATGDRILPACVHYGPHDRVPKIY